MERETERRLAAHAVELGRLANPAVLPELIGLLDTPSPEVRRLAASAIGKLAGIADAEAAVAALTRTLRDKHPQVRQYAVKALKAYGTTAESALADLRDIASNDSEKAYNRRDA
ncbi:MAG: HEAT repeat domain-containing protein [Kiritimatiellae bacterium]|nr:HEAT repeat domain-containing protein [Kiritimatiellia bacterium]